MANWNISWQRDGNMMTRWWQSNTFQMFFFNQGDIMPAMFLSGIQIIDYLKWFNKSNSMFLLSDLSSKVSALSTWFYQIKYIWTISFATIIKHVETID